MTSKILFSITLILVASFKQVSANDFSGLVELKEWKVSWEGRPRDPFVAPSGKVWFCGQAGNYIARLDPSTGKFTKFEVPEASHPHNLIVDAKGFVWYAGNQNAHIGKLDPATGKIIRYDMPDGINDPHTLVFDHNQNVWFTAQHSNAVGHLNTRTGKVRYVKAKTNRSRPYGIKMDSKDRPWIVMVGTNKLATVDPESFKLTEISLPREDARPRRLEITADDSVWYVDYAGSFLGQYRADTKQFNEWKMPSGNRSFPYGTALDVEQRIWIAETGLYPNKLVAFDTKKKIFLGATEVKSGGSVRHMYFDANSNSFWFGVDTGFISRARVLKAGK